MLKSGQIRNIFQRYSHQSLLIARIYVEEKEKSGMYVSPYPVELEDGRRNSVTKRA